MAAIIARLHHCGWWHLTEPRAGEQKMLYFGEFKHGTKRLSVGTVVEGSAVELLPNGHQGGGGFRGFAARLEASSDGLVRSWEAAGWQKAWLQCLVVHNSGVALWSGSVGFGGEEIAVNILGRELQWPFEVVEVLDNSSPKPDPRKSDGQAVTLWISGDLAASYSCKFIGFQDTLCDDRGRHLFQSCYIEGSVDFIFGNGKSLYRDTTIKSVAENLGVIAAQDMNGQSGDSGFVFVHYKIQGTGDMYLGRAWKDTSRVVFAYTYMGSNINSGGWMKSPHQKNVFYGEYQCSGPGSSASNRKFGKTLSDDQVKPFLSTTFIGGSQWLVPIPKIG
ncbi:hypothetical protein F2P56_022690 [Juglans regia]|uniref:Pectinesterase n=1 Tax=Juglans regia TaxID=51240 RepID=A0A833X3Z3_JUGRE|nr:hypothetical protein F2P56_022690 [Juglans regia]